MKPSDFQAITFPINFWEDDFAKSVFSCQTNSDNEAIPMQETFDKTCNYWQTVQDKGMIWQDSSTDVLSSVPTRAGKVLTRQDSFTESFSSWLSSSKNKQFLLSNIFDNSLSLWQANSDKLAWQDRSLKSFYSWQTSSDSNRIRQESFGEPCNFWQTSYSNREPMSQNFENSCSFWQKIAKNEQENISDKRDSLLQNNCSSTARNLSDWQTDYKSKESEWQCSSANHNFFSMQTSSDNRKITSNDNLETFFTSLSRSDKELTRINGFENFFSLSQIRDSKHNKSDKNNTIEAGCLLSQVCSNKHNESSKPATSSSCHDIDSPKLDFLSSFHLWPKNSIYNVWEKRISEYHNTETNKCDSEKFTLSEHKKTLKNHKSKQFLNKVKYSLINSACHNSENKHNKMLDGIEEQDEVDCIEGKLKGMNRKSFYRIDLSSPMGQSRIQHLKGDPSLYILTDIENHCLTSDPDKNLRINRLRERPKDYPITYRGFLQRSSSSHVHQYKFTHKQKLEFMRRVNTGLDKKSRMLFKTLKTCKVRLSKLSNSDLRRWMIYPYEIRVKLKALSLEEILYWTSPKSDFSRNFVDSLANFNSSLEAFKVGSITGQDFSLDYDPYGDSLGLLECEFVCKTEQEKVEHESLNSETTNYESCAFEIEELSLPISSSSDVTCQKKSSVLCSKSAKHLHDSFTLNVNKFRKNSSCHKKPGSCGAYTSNCSHPNGLQESLDSVPSLCHKNKPSQHRKGSIRSGIHTVCVVTSFDGQTINSLVDVQTDCAGNDRRKSRKLKQIENILDRECSEKSIKK